MDKRSQLEALVSFYKHPVYALIVLTAQQTQKNLMVEALNLGTMGLDGLIERGRLLDKTGSYLFFDSQMKDLMVELQEKINQPNNQ